MFLKKKLIAAALVAALGLSVFAQVSNTNTATQEIFGTDVDAYMDVNSWSTVEPESFFAYVKFDSGKPHLGFAKDFGAFYWGTYFAGNFGNISNHKEVAGNNTSITNNSGDTTGTAFAFFNLFGFGNIGVKLELNYLDQGSSKTKTGDVTTTSNRKNIYGNLTAGLSDFELAGLKMLPFVKISYDNNENVDSITTIDNNGNKTITDDRYALIGAGLGATIILKETDFAKQSLYTFVEFTNTKPRDKEIKDVSTTTISFPVEYTIEINATEKLKLGFNVGSENSIDMAKNGPNTKSTEFDFDPYVRTALTFDTGKKVVLNAGFGIESILPTMNTGKTTDTTFDPSTTTTTKTINATNANLSFSSGFAIKPTQNLTIDCSFEMLANILGSDFRTDLTTGGNDLWNTINDVLIYDIGFEISYKL